MRIPSRVYNNPDLAARLERAKKGDESKKTSAPASESAKRVGSEDVRVSVSSQARQLADDSAIDAAKVEKLRALIDSGDFEIDAGKIANRIVERGG